MSVLLTVEQAAERLQLAPKTVRAMARRNQLPGQKVGRSWRFSAAQLEKAIGTRGNKWGRDNYRKDGAL